MTEVADPLSTGGRNNGKNNRPNSKTQNSLGVIYNTSNTEPVKFETLRKNIGTLKKGFSLLSLDDFQTLRKGSIKLDKEELEIIQQQTNDGNDGTEEYHIINAEQLINENIKSMVVMGPDGNQMVVPAMVVVGEDGIPTMIPLPQQSHFTVQPMESEGDVNQVIVGPDGNLIPIMLIPSPDGTAIPITLVIDSMGQTVPMMVDQDGQLIPLPINPSMDGNYYSQNHMMGGGFTTIMINGQPCQIPCDQNGQPIFINTTEPQGFPMILGPEGQPIPVMFTPDGQLAPVMMGPDGHPFIFGPNCEQIPIIMHNGQPIISQNEEFTIIQSEPSNPTFGDSEEPITIISYDHSPRSMNHKTASPAITANDFPTNNQLNRATSFTVLTGPDGEKIQVPCNQAGQPIIYGADGNPLEIISAAEPQGVQIMIGPDGQSIPFIYGADGQPIPVIIAPDGQPIPIMMGPNGETIPVMFGSDGQPIPIMIGPNGERFPIMMGPDGQPVPVMMGPDGPIPIMITADGQFIPINYEQYASTEEESEVDTKKKKKLQKLNEILLAPASLQSVAQTKENKFPKQVTPAKQTSPNSKEAPIPTIPKGFNPGEGGSGPGSAPGLLSKSEGSKKKSKLVPSDWGTLRPRASDKSSRPKKSILHSNSDGVPASLRSSTSTNRLTLTSSWKKHQVKLHGEIKKVEKLQIKQQKELKQYRKSLDARVQVAREKYEGEVERILANMEREQKSFEKLQEKLSKTSGDVQVEDPKVTEQKYKKISNLFDQKLQEAKKNEKSLFATKKTLVQAELKRDMETKLRNKYTYDKKYVKKLKYSHKFELSIYDKLHLVELEYQKLYSDLNVILEQQIITNEISIKKIQEANKIDINNMKECNKSILNNYNKVIDLILQALEGFHSEETAIIKDLHLYQLNQFEKRFKGESEHQGSLLATSRTLRRKAEKDKESRAEIDKETEEMAKTVFEELEALQQSQKLMLEQRFADELNKLKTRQNKEIFDKKFQAANHRVSLFCKFHESEKELNQRGKEKEKKLLTQIQDAFVATAKRGQEENCKFLENKRTEILECISKETYNFVEGYLERLENIVNDHFQQKIAEITEEYQLNNQVLAAKHEKTHNDLEECYVANCFVFETRCKKELEEYQRARDELTNQYQNESKKTNSN